MMLILTQPGDCMCAFSPETDHVICSHTQFQIIQNSRRPCSVRSKGNSKIAVESAIPEAEVYFVIGVCKLFAAAPE